ncbi:unnamed protein product [Peronospora destructor]|uniref:Uncharacterized protein n=1 Tax=Peronospora destructor TaxID=86335 RepID=A0AAV0VGV8_9STRA|nr:unnamed protein product [Peronospora destructor]
MTGPPSPKRQRINDNKSDENESKKVKEVLEKVQKVEEELEQVNVEQAKEILGIETKYNAKKHSIYVTRNKLLTEIPHFWKQVFVNHKVVSSYITEDDKKLMDYLQTLDVTFVGDDGSFKIEMSFTENPYFSPTTLWKQVKLEEEETEVTTSEVTWKDKGETTEEPTRYFFNWFTTTDGDQEIAEIIQEEIWKNPVRYFLMNEDEDDDEDDDEEEEEEQEEDEEQDEEDEQGGEDE